MFIRFNVLLLHISKICLNYSMFLSYDDSKKKNFEMRHTFFYIEHESKKNVKYFLFWSSTKLFSWSRHSRGCFIYYFWLYSHHIPLQYQCNKIAISFIISFCVLDVHGESMNLSKSFHCGSNWMKKMKTL